MSERVCVCVCLCLSRVLNQNASGKTTASGRLFIVTNNNNNISINSRSISQPLTKPDKMSSPNNASDADLNALHCGIHLLAFVVPLSVFAVNVLFI